MKTLISKIVPLLLIVSIALYNALFLYATDCQCCNKNRRGSCNTQAVKSCCAHKTEPTEQSKVTKTKFCGCRGECDCSFLCTTEGPNKKSTSAATNDLIKEKVHILIACMTTPCRNLFSSTSIAVSSFHAIPRELVQTPAKMPLRI